MTYSCYNRADYRQGFFVQDGWIQEGQVRKAKVKFSPFRMNPECQYTKTDLGRADEKCKDCKHRESFSLSLDKSNNV